MQIIPAIDLKDGQCVRLQQGNLSSSATVTVFSDQPAAVALRWLEEGATRLHLVDLNGAVAGRPKNETAIRAIITAIDGRIPIQLGGGIRSLETIEQYLDGGITDVIIGTAAIKIPGFLDDACSAFPGHIIAALDARDGLVATDGWRKQSEHSAIDMARHFQDDGVEAIIYTDIGRDGMLQGINIEATRLLAEKLRVPVIASGGLASLSDITALCQLEDEGVKGVIAGRAIYDGTLSFAEAQKLAQSKSSQKLGL